MKNKKFVPMEVEEEAKEGRMRLKEIRRAQNRKWFTAI